MSKPIVEPSTPLGLARQGFNIRELQRRPVYPGLSQTLGGVTQTIYLPLIGNSPNTDDCLTQSSSASSMNWQVDVTAPGGGYVTRDVPADESCFTFMAQMWPTGSVWGLTYVYGVGPDYGMFDISVASLVYESSERQTGCPAGKIQGWDEAYGPELNYMLLATQDAYDASPAYQPLNGDDPFVIGGDPGDPLTDFTDVGNPCADNVGHDQFTGFNMWDGGPGWYRFRFQVNGKNASSSDYRCRITHIGLIRLDDAGYL